MGLNNANMVEHYKVLYERHMAKADFYQAQLYHAWKSLAQQQKGLRRQAKKIKRLQQFKLVGYVTPNSFPPNKGAERIYVVDEEGFDGCTVALYIKEKQDEIHN